MSDTLEYVKAGAAVFTVIFTGFISIQTLRMNIKASAAEREVRTVKETLVASTKNVDEKLNTIHTLVNSGKETLLRIIAIAHRRVYVLTNDPDDEKAALLSEELLRDHEAQQAIVDAKSHEKYV